MVGRRLQRVLKKGRLSFPANKGDDQFIPRAAHGRGGRHEGFGPSSKVFIKGPATPNVEDPIVLEVLADAPIDIGNIVPETMRSLPLFIE